ncbi:hypothetical protein FJT64_025506 [Amphibalanus amphitrite]|uniref:Uncharacterized protein n=1 Tax=Amphibalanus amphitrite TaxID=1232801 RepID=A0A6A4WI22_AMPAM|nr:hypothetical protein FJT64_025506 [Amphibalanus amphitrite]
MYRKGYIGKNQLKYLIPDRPRPGQVQGNPKVHKEGNPLRLIVDGRNHATERLAEMAEQELQQHVEGLDSYVRDTGDFLQKLKQLPQPSRLSCLGLCFWSLVTAQIVRSEPQTLEQLKELVEDFARNMDEEQLRKNGASHTPSG